MRVYSIILKDEYEQIEEIKKIYKKECINKDVVLISVDSEWIVKIPISKVKRGYVVRLNGIIGCVTKIYQPSRSQLPYTNRVSSFRYIQCTFDECPHLYNIQTKVLLYVERTKRIDKKEKQLYYNDFIHKRSAIKLSTYVGSRAYEFLKELGFKEYRIKGKGKGFFDVYTRMPFFKDSSYEEDSRKTKHHRLCDDVPGRPTLSMSSIYHLQGGVNKGKAVSLDPELAQALMLRKKYGGALIRKYKADV